MLYHSYYLSVLAALAECCGPMSLCKQALKGGRMTASVLHPVFIEEMQDLYSAENQLVEALPKMISGAQSNELKELLSDHLEETKEHVTALKEIAADLGFEISGKTCDGMKGLLTEGEHILRSMQVSLVRDLALTGAAQKVEHYEIVGYRNASMLAAMMEHSDAVDAIEAILEDEEDMDENLLENADVLLADLDEKEEEAQE